MNLNRVAERVAKSYARKLHWRCEFADLVQEARLACAEAARTFDETRGVPLAAYAYSAAVKALWKYALKSGSPVSASDHHLRELTGKAMHAAPLDALPERADAQPWPDAVLAEQQWREAVVDRLEALVQNEVIRGRWSTDVAMAVLDVVLSDRQPSEVLRDGEWSDPDNPPNLAQVYQARRRLSLLVLHDLRCYRLWKEP